MRADDSRLLDLIALAIDQRSAGEEPDVPALCADCPELADELARALRAHERIRDASPAPSSGDPLVGTRVGDRYVLVRRIGSGATGAVFAARDLVLGRFVGVKLLDPWIVHDAERRARFRREAFAIASLRHPGIVAVHDHGESPHPHVVMDLESGIDLEGLLLQCEQDGARESDSMGALALAAFDARATAESGDPSSPFRREELRPDPAAWSRPWAEIVARIATDVADALAHAHEHKVLHRDVKPTNILVRPDGRAVLLDFGLARLPEQESLTREGEIVGTLAYMAPEQARGRSASIEAPADLYGLGATLYRMLTGRRPFDGPTAAVVRQVLWDDPVPVRSIAPRVPRDLAAVCQMAMSKRPAERYRDAGAMAADLRAFVEREAVQASLPGWPRRVVRRALRRPGRWAVPLLVVIASYFGSAAWDGHVARAAAKTRTGVLTARAGIPALLTLEGLNPAYSVGPPAPRDPLGRGRAALDAVLRADPDDDGARLWRAMLHADEGRQQEALADLRALAARHADSIVATELGTRIAAIDLAAEASWQQAIADRLARAPIAFDGFAAAYVAIRAARYDDARRFLDEALELDPAYEPALDLLMVARLLTGEIGPALDAATRLEGIFGRPTARTRHVTGVVLMTQGRWREAIEAFEESLVLCPDQHGPLQNLAAAHQQLREHEPALEAVEKAARIRPDAVQTKRTQLRLLSALDRRTRFDELVAELETTAGGKVWWTEFEAGAAELRDAIRAIGAATGDPTGDACRRAAARFDSALELMRGLPVLGERSQAATWRDLALMLADNQYAPVAGRMLAAIGGGASDPGTMHDAALLLRREPATADVAVYLLSQANAAAPDDHLLAADLIHALVDRGGATFVERAARVWQYSFSSSSDAGAAKLRDLVLAAADTAAPGNAALRDRIAALLTPPGSVTRR
ncbi:MAG: protein kinase [Planctomycetes bacterium]|nr:protein kinase [Planctomycetota bacterium]